jgi:hypothetical protein
MENHTTCQLYSTSGGELPTRILHVGLPGEQTPEVRLYEPGQGETGIYVALSHCWGKSQMLKTEKGLIDERKRRIPWNIIPKSFQDAITFVRGLGLHYLWIDSLCIVQDDKNDWEKESAKMASIYKNSLLTIAAAKSIDSTGGCFSVVPLMGRTYEINGTDKEARPFVIYARPKVSNWVDPALPLFSRAWCFQERELSTRVVYFQHHELEWQCQTMRGSESSLKMSHREVEKVSGLGSESDPHSMNDIWRKRVREYVELDLTYASDRLPALSGLAKHIQLTYGRGRYLAGLWTDSLLEDLMWWVREEHIDRMRRPETWRAPSWSWASLEGPIYQRIFPIKLKHCEILEADVTPAGLDPTGAVSSGKLVISGIAVPAILQHIQPKTPTEDSEPDERRFGFEVSGNKGGTIYMMYVDYNLDEQGPGHVAVGEELCCLCLATDQWHKCWMVLRKAAKVTDAYERIGMAWQRNKQVEEGADWANGIEKRDVITIV